MALQAGIAKQIHSAGKPAALSEEVSYVTRRSLAPIDEGNEEANAAERDAEETASIDAEEEAAAVKIQAAHRGAATRRRIAERRRR